MLVMPESKPATSTDVAEVPPGFKPLHVGGAYFQQLGPVYSRPDDTGGLIIALRVAERHLNIQGITHGGMLVTLADGALGINIALARERKSAQVTVSLTADFLSGGRLGDWLEAHTTITRMGQRMAYASCDLKVAARHVLRSSGVFAFVDRPWPPAAIGGEAPLQDC
ncbi:MAG TPA: PaaI family thioesterase [Burkholderiaceae bacterium]|nr:PaaI family thioesterase [Burkholderiaceae bacterium]